MKLKSIQINFLFPGFMLLFSLNNVFAQGTASDTAFYENALVNSMSVYHQSFGNQSALYNGSKYPEYPFRFAGGHPFFNAPQPVPGSVIYDGILYDSVLMRYDEVTDVLIINARVNRIQLLTEKVEYFNLFNSEFIRMIKDSLSNSLVSSGFYNILYKGETSLIKKQIKTIREVISNAELLRYIDEKNHYYIQKDGRIYSITKKDNLFDLFADRKKEVQQFIKINRLNFRKDRQNMLTKTVAYYDSLKK